MATAPGPTEVVLYDTLVNYLVSMARSVESAMNRALDAIVNFENPRTAALPGEVFLLMPSGCCAAARSQTTRQG